MTVPQAPQSPRKHTHTPARRESSTFRKLMHTLNDRTPNAYLRQESRLTSGGRHRSLLSLGLSVALLGLLGMPSAGAAGTAEQLLAPAAPLAPSTPSAVHNGNTAVMLRWTDRSTNELVFGIQYRDHGGTWKNVSSVASTTSATTGTTYTFTHAVRYGTIFCYRTSAGNLGGTNYSPEACAVPAAPSSPTDLRTTGLGAHSVWLSFNRSTVWEWGYRLYTKRAGDSAWVLNKELVSRPPTSTRESMVADNLISDRYYCFRVVAFNSRGQSLPTNEVCAVPSQPIE